MAEMQYLDFEKPLEEIQQEIEALRAEEEPEEDNLSKINDLEKKLKAERKQIYGNLTPWQRVLISRHMARPRTLDYVEDILTDWVEIKGDRQFHDDNAVVCGIGRLDGKPVVLIGQQKGKDTKENVERNFGMMHPEGYRKAMRAMRLAERFNLPIIVLIDTPGAYPGLGAEERGQGEAIARNIMEMFSIRTPIIGVVIGEGASGGALGIGVVDKMLMFENSWYCVISPEGCASILWRDAGKAREVANKLHLTAKDLLKLNVIDEVLPEPRGGAHYDPEAACRILKQALIENLESLIKLDKDDLTEKRFQKYRVMGVFNEGLNSALEHA